MRRRCSGQPEASRLSRSGARPAIPHLQPELRLVSAEKDALVEQHFEPAFARPDLLEMARQHFNEPMLCFFDLVRCIGYGEDESDCYVLVRRPNPHRDILWVSCVGGYTFLDRLRGQNQVRSTGGEDWDDLTRLDSQLALNGAPLEPQFLLLIEGGGDGDAPVPLPVASGGDGEREA